MGSPAALPQGTTQEAMWPAATAEEWKKPCLVRWQRTFDDAMRVAREKHEPILVAVNMDGEIASEHYAGVRYREPETAALMNRYACVVASVYRHTPRDYDEQGRRVPCPRFQTVTCGEHIEAERELYAKYFEGKRVSPRHIVLGLDGAKTYDVYFSWDTATVFTTFRTGVEGWPPPIERHEKTTVDLTKSADVDDRERLERAYVEGNREAKRAILTSLAKEHVVDQAEVLRTAIFGLDLELAGLARRALAQCDTDGSLDLMAAALQAQLDEGEKKVLLDAVGRMAKSLPRARTLAALHSGLSQGSKHIDTDALAREYDATSVRGVDVDASARASAARPNEPGARLEFAEALLARAQESFDRRYATLLYQEAQSTAREAERLGAKGPRLDAVVAVTAAEFNDLDTARDRAVSAIEGGLLHLGDAAAPQGAKPGAALTAASRSRLLRLFADARQRAIRAAFREGKTWPPEWLSDVHAAYSVVAGDALAEPTPLVDYYDFLHWIGAASRANEVLEDALRRFPDSAVLHDRLRGKLLWEGGPELLERGYAERLARADAPNAAASQLSWFAGYATLVAAEHHRRRGAFERSVASYDRAVSLYERNAQLFPEGRDTCLHFEALARAGKARVALDRGDLDGATRELIAALELRPDSAATPDGLGITPVATALMLKARLAKAGDADRGAQVQAALDALDPRLLATPESEPIAPQSRGARGSRGRPR